MNECDLVLSVGSCEDICVNTIGSYFCKCFDGRTLVNGSLCNGKKLLNCMSYFE